MTCDALRPAPCNQSPNQFQVKSLSGRPSSLFLRGQSVGSARSSTQERAKKSRRGAKAGIASNAGLGGCAGGKDAYRRGAGATS